MAAIYSVAAESGPRLRLVRWCVRSRWGVALSGLSLEEAEERCAERNAGAAKLPPNVDPESRCTCRQQRWRCAADEYAAHLRRAGA